MKRRMGCTVGEVSAGGLLVDFMASRFTYHNRAEWRQEIDQGRVLQNHRPAGPAATVQSGDTLEYLFETGPEPEVCEDFSVLYEDDDLLAVNKPANLPCHPGGRYFNHTLWACVRARLKLDYLAPVNRLDRETSGVVLMAKQPAAARNVGRQFAEGLVEKRYLVLIEGEFPAEQLAAGFMSRNPASRIRKKWRFTPLPTGEKKGSSPKSCCTVFRRLATARGVSLLEAKLQTGRCHQIRATLCSLGYPVVGDKIYGLDEGVFIRFINDALQPADHENMRLARQGLHGAELLVLQPRTGQPLRFSAPMPSDMACFVGANFGAVDFG